MFTYINKNKINNLPKTPGVYCFTEKTGNRSPHILYIGKAVNIQNRAKDHFLQPTYHDNLFINKVDKIGYLETNSEIEALILEASLIKKYRPRFNIMWRDDKNYFYVAVAQNDQKIPYIFITHRPSYIQTRANTLYIGPFVEGTALKKTLRFLRRIFPYYTSRKHPKVKCTYCHLGLCPGINPNLADYKKNIKNLILILRGKKGAVLQPLREEMKQFSKKENFEMAAKIRDRINSLEKIMLHCHVIENKSYSPTIPDIAKKLQSLIGSPKPVKRIEAYDVSNIQGKYATGSMVVFINGVPEKKQYKKFKIKIEKKPNDIAMLKEVLERRFSHKDWRYPEAMLIDGGKAQFNLALRIKKNKNIKILSIAKGKGEIFVENKKGPIAIKSLPREIQNLILRLNNEAHRFAIGYHKKLRREAILKK